MRKDERGFTLIEMLIVLFVIGIILAIALPNLAKTGDVAENEADEANRKVLLAQAENYRLAEGSYPDTVQQLVNKGYLEEAPKCPNSGETYTFNVSSSGSLTVSCQ